MPGDSRFCAACGARLTKAWIALAALGVALFMVLLPGTLYVWAGLPTTSNLSSARLPLSTRIYDRTGKVLLAEIHQGSERRHLVPLAQIAPAMQRATIAVEDHDFYRHGGIDLPSIARAAFDDLVHGRIAQGGSTITQQLAKNVYLSDDRSILRKLDEAILAVEIEHRYSKSQILEAYLNRVYYGNQAYGVEAAAETYFGSHAADLSTAQASFLAGLPAAPSDLDPYLNLSGAKSRQRAVLAAMVRSGQLTQAEAAAAFAQPLRLQPVSAGSDVRAPHFVHWIASQLEKTYGDRLVQQGGLTVITSLDWRLQSIAQSQVRSQVAALHDHHVTDGALVAVDPRTGGVLAMVGSAGIDVPGADYNMALVPRQPGSAFKIFTYSAGIESGKVTMGSWILDEPIRMQLSDGSFYQPHNYDGSYHGWQPIPFALGNSLNIPAVKVEVAAGIPQVVDAARRMGVTSLNASPDSYQPSLTLGGYEVPLLDMAAGAGTLAAQGTYHRPQGIVKVVSHEGETLFSDDPRSRSRPGLSPQVSFIMSSMLADDRNRQLEFGRNSALVIPGHHVAAKTGTTSDFRDNLTVGYTPDLAVAVWVGNADHSPMQGVTGITGAAPIFHGFMVDALQGAADTWFSPPPGLQVIEVDGFTAYLLPGTVANQPPPPSMAIGSGGEGGHHGHHGGGGGGGGGDGDSDGG
jgi:membrane peptidoglycan carboxypeptidase